VCVVRGCLNHYILRFLTSKVQFHHHQWQNGPFWAIVLLRRFCQISSGFHFFGFRNVIVSCRARLSVCVQPPQPGGPGLCIYVPQWQSGPVIPPGTGFPFRRFLQFGGLPPHEAKVQFPCDQYVLESGGISPRILDLGTGWRRVSYSRPRYFDTLDVGL
jgi:hypothetical protein